MSEFGLMVQEMQEDRRDESLEILQRETEPDHVYDQFTKAMKAVGIFVRREVDPLKQRILELEQQVEMLKSGGITYKGVWQPGTYRQGQLVTSGGSLWHCNVETCSRPGENSDFTLCVKRGKDAA
jgi:hypothetical protein